ncbi:hypothetical protein HS088_TW13G01020 [Tripterygium wilfordii]|uniref:Uncharacterized protein n=1 Tax=Tripterygium wilfordii TaxID=458696 RepID=A0A7J7CVG3_TRIWF|nr:hypothetical protein HS088_TW13G01020 [Tripterygium wilfordii]
MDTNVLHRPGSSHLTEKGLNDNSYDIIASITKRRQQMKDGAKVGQAMKAQALPPTRVLQRRERSSTREKGLLF